MYQPYVYYIIFIHPITQQRLYYVGCKYSNSKFNGIANPKDFWVTYFTSSPDVEKLRQEFGNDCFITSIRKVFQDKQTCLDYEKKLLTKLNAKDRHDFINKSNGGVTFYSTHQTEETKRKMSLAKIGKKFTDEHKANLKKNHKGRTGKKATIEQLIAKSIINSGEKNPMYGKHHLNDVKNKISMASLEAWKNAKIIQCPHCFKEGIDRAMKRWHFNKCKLKQ